MPLTVFSTMRCIMVTSRKPQDISKYIVPDKQFFLLAPLPDKQFRLLAPFPVLLYNWICATSTYHITISTLYKSTDN